MTSLQIVFFLAWHSNLQTEYPNPKTDWFNQAKSVN